MVLTICSHFLPFYIRVESFFMLNLQPNGIEAVYYCFQESKKYLNVNKYRN